MAPVTRRQNNVQILPPLRLINDIRWNGRQRDLRPPNGSTTPTDEPSSPIRRRLLLPKGYQNNEAGLDPLERVVRDSFHECVPDDTFSRGDIASLSEVSCFFRAELTNNRDHQPWRYHRCDNMVIPESNGRDFRPGQQHLPGPMSKCPFKPGERGEVRRCQGQKLGLPTAIHDNHDIWVCEHCNRLNADRYRVNMYYLPLCKSCTTDWTTLNPRVALNHPKFDCDCMQEYNDRLNKWLCNACRHALWMQIQQNLIFNATHFLPVLWPNASTSLDRVLSKHRERVLCGCWCGLTYDQKKWTWHIGPPPPADSDGCN